MDRPLLASTIEREADVVMVRVAGEIDLTSAAQLRSTLLSAVEGPPPPAVVRVDLAGISFIDATGVRVLVEAHEVAARGAQVLSVQDPSRIVARVLDVLDLTDFLQAGPGTRRGPRAPNRSPTNAAQS